MYVKTLERWLHVTVFSKNHKGKEQEEGRGRVKVKRELSEVNNTAVFEGRE